jgi:hypothetical protein
VTESEFRTLALEGEAVGGDYAAGYRRGLRRLYHGERFGTEEEHARYMALLGDPDLSRSEIGRGYRDGLAGRRPNWSSTQEAARQLGRRTSPAKAAAARLNGARGGRPRKLRQD